VKGSLGARRRVLQQRARVYLRAPVPGDRDEFLALNRASARLYRGKASPMTSARAFAAYLARCQRPDFAGLLVCRVDTGGIVGVFNVGQIFRGVFRSAYLGYQAFAPHAGQGYMTDAMPLVLRHVFGTLRLHRIEANIQPTNRASLALVKRAGFTREGFSRRYLKIGGRWRDHERWALLVEDWRAQRRGARRTGA
jgi:ribosomal-protein-alanine N-acetyltransferase